VSFFANQTFDSIVTASRRELDEAKRNQLYRQADSIAFVEAPMVFLYFYNELYSVQPWIKQFVPPVIFNGQRWTDVILERKRTP
jgi:peptide/nickel transport system substrate-binding protein/oligopeptide transport system substrate-binding protein